MPLLTLANIRHSYGTHLVLDGATLSLERGEKIGLVGRNGSGKTTLMRIIQGALPPDGGSIQVMRGARVGYLAQHIDLDPDDTVRDAAESAFAELHALHLELNELFDAMATAQGDALERLLRRQARVESALEAAGGYAIDHRIEATLHGLGFTDEQFTLKVSKLSGGQRGRLGLARLLLEEPDLLLLDEPTNHLDIPGRQWLETFLADEYGGAVVVVSHDRWLLDRVVHRIIDVEAGHVREYPGNYAKYIELRAERQLTQARVHAKQLDRVRQEEQFIRRYKAGQRAKQAKGRESRLQRFKSDMVERPVEMNVMRLTLPKPARSGDMVISGDRLTKRYGDLTLFHDFDIALKRGDRIGVIGPNGAGKTTLVRCLVGELEPDAGSVRTGSRLSVGYYRQLQEQLDLSLTIWQYLQSVIVSIDGAAKASEQQARDLAGAFLFSGAEQDKTLDLLSGGERSRVVLAGLVAGAHNVLVLDEPSNHLDIPSAERLEQSLSPGSGWDGTLLLISHDRALLEATCDALLVFGADGPGSVRLFLGKYSEWEENRRADLVAARGRAESARGSGGGGAAKATSKSRAKAKSKSKSAGSPGEAKRPAGPHVRKKTRELEAEIEGIEMRLGVIDAELSDPEVYRDGERCKELTGEREELARALAGLEEEWGRRAEEG